MTKKWIIGRQTVRFKGALIINGLLKLNLKWTCLERQLDDGRVAERGDWDVFNICTEHEFK